MQPRDTTLLPRQQARARERYLWFTRLNGLSIACLADNILILYALQVGLPESLVGLLAALMYLAMPFALLGRSMTARLGTASMLRWAWVLRNGFGLLMVAAPPVSAGWGVGTGLGLLLLGATGFFAFRSAGIAGISPLIAEITTQANRGQFIGRAFFGFTSMNLLTMGALVGAMRLWPGTETFQGIIFLGASAGFVSAWVVGGVPETEAPRRSARQGILRSVRDILRTGTYRRLMMTFLAGQAAILLVVPLSMAALKKGYAVSDDTAFILTLVQLLGGVLVSLLVGVLADHTGPKPLVILAGMGLLAVALLWAVAPANFYWPFGLAVFLAAGVCMTGMNIALGHHLLACLPEQQRVVVGLLVHVVSGLLAGLVGAAVGSGLLKLLLSLGLDGISLYHGYFRILPFLLLPMLYALTQMRRFGDWRVPNVLGLLVSPRDLRVLHAIGRVSDSASPREDSTALRRLDRTDSPHKQPALLCLLDSPEFSIRAKALEALREIPLDRSAQDALLRELTRGEYTTAYIAATLLGEKRIARAIPNLRQAMHTGDFFLQGKCMVALARLGDTESLPDVAALFQRTNNPRLVIHGALALSIFGRDEDAGPILRKSLQPDLPDVARHECLYYATVLAGCGDEFYQFLKTYRRDPSQALPLVAEVDAGSPKPDDDELAFPLDDLRAGRISPSDLIRRLRSIAGRAPQHDTFVRACRDLLDRYADLEPETIYCLWEILTVRLRNTGT